MKIALGSDHGGLELKRKVFEFLKSKNYECTDCGTYDDKSVDYPDYAKAVCDEVLSGKAEKGILFCGTGIGISIAANKINGIRCANLSDTYSAAKCVEHNDCNVISLGGRTLGVPTLPVPALSSPQRKPTEPLSATMSPVSASTSTVFHSGLLVSPRFSGRCEARRK